MKRTLTCLRVIDGIIGMAVEAYTAEFTLRALGIVTAVVAVATRDITRLDVENGIEVALI